MKINVRETGMIEQVCTCGIGHPTKEGVEYMYNRFNGEGNTRRTWEVHGCCMIPGHCWLVDRDNEKKSKAMLSMRAKKGNSNRASVLKLQRVKGDKV